MKQQILAAGLGRIGGEHFARAVGAQTQHLEFGRIRLAPGAAVAGDDARKIRLFAGFQTQLTQRHRTGAVEFAEKDIVIRTRDDDDVAGL